MNCVNCGAALPARTDICGYCQTRNDTDLRRFDVLPGEDSGRVCPRCASSLPTVTVLLGAGVVHVERCQGCLGIFFDRYELEDVLKQSVEGITDVDFQRLAALAEERKIDEHPSLYVNCPICREPMHRRAYRRRSGVVVHSCKDHGLWLDGGALGSLLRWARVGGLQLGPSGAGGTWEDLDPATIQAAEAAMAGSPGGEPADQAGAGDPGSTASRERRDPLQALESLGDGKSSDSGSGREVLRKVEDAITDVLSLLVRLARN